MEIFNQDLKNIKAKLSQTTKVPQSTNPKSKYSPYFLTLYLHLLVLSKVLHQRNTITTKTISKPFPGKTSSTSFSLKASTPACLLYQAYIRFQVRSTLGILLLKMVLIQLLVLVKKSRLWQSPTQNKTHCQAHLYIIQCNQRIKVM